ncbi:abortive infection protein [Thermoclostridium stercorarium subsp. stercorarium DSM 8532]|uniref:Abortive infection protein n=3 Tax=Thermoclostridium stercorarium TaxID=1510 RepID=L7VQJ1_THES1|nr:CPBP family intramembrane glutamic endopeptidase [Thermoclostridium stercorarium]AGC67838.1 abortive infection protein [Thermoclostridium stercorarium subsp. stercorarium DSM 8532]AGI38878.1 CAAX protease [Thermoclostridium stercorarium subsp. stercorarium DSM 8532]ANW98247.1 abortive infection protein [Thermoclostridium stercorarium subsp. thermolacticum DSM 2910]ANX00780.1 abortive infection protein [Thermoclostridium stercorarium subsp. leptospartum DSM 9219]
MDNVRNEKTPSLTETGLLYSIGAVLLITLGSYTQRRNFTTGILITEFLIILMPSILLLVIRKYDIKHVLRLNRVSFLNLFIVFSIMAVSIWLVSIINIFNLWLIKLVFGKVKFSTLPIGDTPLLINILLIGGTAGICEEVMFRGVIQRSFEKFGAYFSIVVTAFLFGLFHMDFQKLLGTFLLGMLIGFIVYRTDSLFAGMFAHFCNNSIAVLTSFISERIFPSDMAAMQSSGDYLSDYFDLLESMPVFQKITLIGVWIAGALFCAALLAGLIWALVLNTSKSFKPINHSGSERLFPGILAFIPGLLIVTVVYVIIALQMRGIWPDLLLFAL